MAKPRSFDWDEARALYEGGGWTQAALAERYSVSKTAIFFAVHPETYKERRHRERGLLDRAENPRSGKEHGVTITEKGYRLFVNDERTILVRLWPDGTVEVATREATWETWGPPVYLKEES